MVPDTLLLALVIVLVILLVAPKYIHREKPKEGYGPPPGVYRALGHRELGDRGWPDRDPAYEASTASAISHVVLRSA